MEQQPPRYVNDSKMYPAPTHPPGTQAVPVQMRQTVVNGMKFGSHEAEQWVKKPVAMGLIGQNRSPTMAAITPNMAPQMVNGQVLPKPTTPGPQHLQAFQGQPNGINDTSAMPTLCDVNGASRLYNGTYHSALSRTVHPTTGAPTTMAPSVFPRMPTQHPSEAPQATSTHAGVQQPLAKIVMNSSSNPQYQTQGGVLQQNGGVHQQQNPVIQNNQQSPLFKQTGSIAQQNGTIQHNGVLNGVVHQNGTIQQNGVVHQNGTIQQNGVLNGVVQQNGAIIQQNGAILHNSVLQQNIGGLEQNGVLPQNSPNIQHNGFARQFAAPQGCTYGRLAAGQSMSFTPMGTVRMPAAPVPTILGEQAIAQNVSRRTSSPTAVANRGQTAPLMPQGQIFVPQGQLAQHNWQPSNKSMVYGGSGTTAGGGPYTTSYQTIMAGNFNTSTFHPQTRQSLFGFPNANGAIQPTGVLYATAGGGSQTTPARTSVAMSSQTAAPLGSSVFSQTNNNAASDTTACQTSQEVNAVASQTPAATAGMDVAVPKSPTGFGVAAFSQTPPVNDTVIGSSQTPPGNEVVAAAAQTTPPNKTTAAECQTLGNGGSGRDKVLPNETAATACQTFSNQSAVESQTQSVACNSVSTVTHTPTTGVFLLEIVTKPHESQTAAFACQRSKDLINNYLNQHTIWRSDNASSILLIADDCDIVMVSEFLESDVYRNFTKGDHIASVSAKMAVASDMLDHMHGSGKLC